MTKALSFKKKVENALKDGFSETEKEVVRTWYKIESKDEDISTHRLLSRVRSRTFLSDGKIIRIMSKFSAKFDRIHTLDQKEQ